MEQGKAMKKLIIKHASELVTCRGKVPKKGADMSDIGIIYNGSVVIEDGIIVDVDEASNISSRYDESEYEVIDASEKAVLPGFIEPMSSHGGSEATHTCR